MKKKQIIGLVAAGAVFIVVSVSSVVTNKLMDLWTAQTESTMMSSVMSMENGFDLPVTPYVARVKVEGTIMETEDTGSIFAQTVGYDHQKTLDYIDALIESDSNRGIFLEVDSPGGSVYETDELYLKLMEYKEKTQRPIWTYMGSYACSGGYYISMASDYIAGNRNGWTGSIGVIISTVNYSELFDKIGVEEINITSGANKAMGSAGIEMTEEHRELMQGLVDEAYEQFTGIVADGRSMDINKVKELADGRIYTTTQAYENGLIDEVAEYEDTKAKFAAELGEEDIEFYEPTTESNNIFADLFAAIGNLRTKSDAEIMNEYIEKMGSGVPMYYAKINN